MGLKYDARLDLSALSDALEKRGLTPGGRVQKAVDEAVIRYCDPKVPFRTGTLKHSAITASAIGDTCPTTKRWAPAPLRPACPPSRRNKQWS